MGELGHRISETDLRMQVLVAFATTGFAVLDPAMVKAFQEQEPVSPPDAPPATPQPPNELYTN